PSLVHDMLSKSGDVSKELSSAFRSISENRDQLRSRLEISTHNDDADSKEPSACAVDGTSYSDMVLGSGLVYSAAFAVEGLIPSSGSKNWQEPLYMTTLHQEKDTKALSRVMTAVMMEMAVELAAQAPHDIVFIRGSMAGYLATIMASLKTALEFKESPTSREFLTRMKTAIVSLQTIVNSNNSRKIRTASPGLHSGKALISHLKLPDTLDDTHLMTLLLSPGEYIGPIKLERKELVRVSQIPIKDEKFAAVRDNLTAAMGELQVVCYRPEQWIPSLTFEVTQSVAEDKSLLSVLLHGIKAQCISAGIHEPYPVYRAGLMVHSMREAFTSLRSSMIQGIDSGSENDIGTLISALLHKSTFAGENNG
ncbi:DNA double-strand break repair nuclease NurA, partial [Candidatus Latescibacterota bacterium]